MLMFSSFYASDMVSRDKFSFLDFLAFLLMFTRSALNMVALTLVRAWSARSWSTYSSFPWLAWPPYWTCTCSAAWWRRRGAGAWKNGAGPCLRTSWDALWGSLSRRARRDTRWIAAAALSGSYLEHMVELNDEFGDLVLDGLELGEEGVHCQMEGMEYSVF